MAKHIDDMIAACLEEWMVRAQYDHPCKGEDSQRDLLRRFLNWYVYDSPSVVKCADDIGLARPGQKEG